jgi:hypothetical protein
LDDQEENEQFEKKSKNNQKVKTNIFSDKFLNSLEEFKSVFRAYVSLKVAKDETN